MSEHDVSTPPARHGRRASHRRRRILLIGAAAAVLLIAGGAIAAAWVLTAPKPATDAITAVPTAPAHPQPFTPITAADLAALPAAVYNAKPIPGLIPAAIATAPRTAIAYQLERDIAVYSADQHTPVARIPHLNFLGQPTTVTSIKTAGAWSLVLTASRQANPSQNGGTAPAQTAGWVRTDQLGHGVTLTARVLISVSKQTVTVQVPGTPDQVFPAGVGTNAAPTPIGVTGTIQARFVDANQDPSGHQISLTTLHSAAKDEPYGGHDGGLIGIHYNPTNTGQVSHGCIRLNITALNALTTLPLGTPITITN